jgi:hypothetical protein
MNLRTLLAAAASAAVFSTSISHAASQNAVLNACARAFATSMASPGTDAPKFKLKYVGSQPSSTFDDYYSGHKYRFDLQAQDPKTGMTLARATCTADTRGTRVALTSTPLDVQEAALAARL